MTNISNRNRVQAGVPTGGEFATEARAENDDLDSGVAPMMKGERNAAIHGIVQHFVDHDILKPTGSNDEFETGDLLLGRDTEGARIFGRATIKWSPRPQTTTDLEDIDGAWRFTISGSTIEKSRRNIDRGGQIDNYFREQGGELSELGTLWAEVHLNDMNAGTETQKVQSEQIKAECTIPSGHDGEPRIDSKKFQDRCFAEIPSDRGYKWGHAWLTKELDPAKVDRALTLMTTLNFKAEQKVAKR